MANLLVKLSSGPKTTLGLKIIVFLNIFLILFSASSLLLAYFECSPSYKPNAEKCINLSTLYFKQAFAIFIAPLIWIF